MCEREGATCCVSWGAPCGAGGVWAGGSGDGKLSRAEPGSPGDAPAHCSALLPARVADLATGGEALPPPPPRSPAPPANPAAPRPLSSPTLCAKRNRAAQPLKFFWILTSSHCHVVYYEWYEPSYQRALKTAQRQGLRQGGEAGVKQAMRQGCVTPLTPGVTGPARSLGRSWPSFRRRPWIDK